MKIPHLCILNYSKWSAAIEGADGTVQFRECEICGRTNYRNVGYAAQVTERQINEALEKIGREE